MAEEKTRPTQPTQPTQPTTVNNNMVKAILTTLCCCLPLGIVSIIKAAEVNKKVASGDIDGAIQSAEGANKWANIGIIVALASWVISIIFFIIAAAIGVEFADDILYELSRSF